jgi:hypothetical protein
VVTPRFEVSPPMFRLTKTWWDVSWFWGQIEIDTVKLCRLFHGIKGDRAMKGLTPEARKIGRAAEYVFGLYLDRRPPPVPESLSESDGGVDFVLPGLVTVDVKGVTGYPEDPWLKIPVEDVENLRAMFYCCVYVDLDRKRGRVVGWASADEIRAAPPMGKIGGVDLPYPAHVLYERGKGRNDWGTRRRGLNELHIGVPDGRAGVEYPELQGRQK